MRIKRHNKDSKLYMKIFIAITLSIVLTMLVLSTVLYVNFEKIALKQLYLANVNSLEQVSNEVAIMSNTASTISNQIYQDITISKLLYYTKADIYDLSPAMRQLTNYRLSLPFLDSIYVYNSNTDTIYTDAGNRGEIQSFSSEFTDKEVVNCISNYKNYKPYIPIFRKYKDDSGTEKYFYTFILYDMLTGSKLNGAIVTNVSADWINNVINNENNSDGGSTFIINSKGVIASNGDDFPMMYDYSSKDYVKNILSHLKSSGYFVDSINGIKSLVVYTKPDSFGWRYVRVIPWTQIFDKIEGMRTITVLIGFGILIIGILIAVIISKRLYIPIGKMRSNLELLETEKRNSTGVLKQEFLRDIIQGRISLNEVNLISRYGELGINIAYERKICALLIKVDCYNDFIQQYDTGDRNLYKFAIMNIATEIFSEAFKTEAIDMGKDCMLVILEVQSLDNDLEKGLNRQIESIQVYVSEYLNLSVSFSVSTLGENMSDINQLYNQITTSSLYRLFYGHKCIIYSSEVARYSSNEYTYPLQKEKQMVEWLIAGKIEDVKSIYNEIISDTQNYPIVAFNHSITHLLFTLNGVINTIKTSNSLFDKFDCNITLMMLNEAETVEEVNMHYYELFDKIGAMLEEKKSVKYENTIRKINEIIKAEYVNPFFSVDSIAESMGMSTPYICRLYKQHTLHTILDEIVKTRMQKARELLLKTDFSVIEISEKVGFSNSTYFHKSFKAFHKVTPSEFRKNPA